MERVGLWNDRHSGEHSLTDGATIVNESDLDLIEAQSKLMSVMRKDKRPAPESEQSDNRAKRQRICENTEAEAPSVELSELDIVYHNVKFRDLPGMRRPEDELDTIIKEMGIEGNPEQERAVRMIAEHFILGVEDQLLMYIAGIGGAGKSHVINAIVEFFKRCGCSQRMLLSAPTGCAAVLIQGYMIHALTFLPKTKWRVKDEELRNVWKNVKYLVIDEISMVSAKLMSEICVRINQAKAAETAGFDTVFGGINVIFLGDMVN